MSLAEGEHRAFLLCHLGPTSGLIKSFVSKLDKIQILSWVYHLGEIRGQSPHFLPMVFALIFRDPFTEEYFFNKSQERKETKSLMGNCHFSYCATSCTLSHLVVSDPFMTPIACQVPLSMEFSRQGHWSRLPFPSLGDFPNPGIEPGSPALAGAYFTTGLPGKPCATS